MGIGRVNAVALANNPRCQVIALCDLLPERMDEIALKLPEKPPLRFTDHRDLCSHPEVDAVFVGTPNQWHVPVALEAIRNDKHVMVTKPLADALEPASKLVAAAEASGVVNMMSLSTRFSPQVQYLGHLAQTGFFGELYYTKARSIRRNGIPNWNLGFIQKGGGAFRDMGVHYLDAAWWIMGLPRPVSVSGVAGAKFGPRGEGYFGPGPEPAKSYWSQYDSDDYGGGLIRFDNGAGLFIESFWASHQQPELQIELFGTGAGAILHPLTLFKTHYGEHQNVKVGMPVDAQASWQNIADHFVSCVLDGLECHAPLRHGMQVQKMMEGLLTSAKTGQQIDLS